MFPLIWKMWKRKTRSKELAELQQMLSQKDATISHSEVYKKHCQRHNGPEGWVLLTKVKRSYITLDQISKFKIFAEHQHFDQTLTFKSWPNIHFITSPSLSSKILTKLRFQKIAWNSTSNSWPNLVLKVGTKISFMTKLQLLNIHKTVVKRLSSSTSATITTSTSFK